MDWVNSLGGLPETVATLVVFAFCIVWIIKSILKRVVDPLAQSHRDTADVIRKAIDTNTDAVKKSVDHNETIITNHLSGQAQRDRVFLDEMRSVSSALEASNQRRRAEDGD